MSLVCVVGVWLACMCVRFVCVVRVWWFVCGGSCVSLVCVVCVVGLCVCRWCVWGYRGVCVVSACVVCMVGVWLVCVVSVCGVVSDIFKSLFKNWSWAQRVPPTLKL